MESRKLLQLILLCFLLTFSTMYVVLGENVTTNRWSYEGENSPDRWGEIDTKYKTCSTGLSQSPISLTSSNLVRKEAEIEIHYQPTPLVVNNNGHSIEVNYQPGSYAIINNKEYELKQFHFHTPSEHTLNGEKRDMELHLVHQDKEGKIAVIGIFIEEGETNLTLAKISDYLSIRERKQAVTENTIDASNFITENASYFHYQGSLTTPPCSENVIWSVVQEPLEASRQEIEEFIKLYSMNARPIQQRNNRIVELIINQSS